LETQVIPKIRPIWIIVGIGIVTFCAAFAMCMAFTSVGLNFILSPKAGATSQARLEETVRPVVVQTTAPTPAIALASTPTQLPLPGVVPPLPVPPGNNNPSVINTVSGDPAEAVRTYYQWVDQNRYDLTWSLLSSDFKDKFNCCLPNYNYTGYVDWWNSIDQIEFADVHTVQQNGSQAAVYMELRYHMKAGGISTDRAYIHLVYDPISGWLFNDKTDTL
jgi:hypothetical protein